MIADWTFGRVSSDLWLVDNFGKNPGSGLEIADINEGTRDRTEGTLFDLTNAEQKTEGDSDV